MKIVRLSNHWNESEQANASFEETCVSSGDWGKRAKLHQNVLMTFKNGVYLLFIIATLLICAILNVAPTKTENFNGLWHRFNEKCTVKCVRNISHAANTKKETKWKTKLSLAPKGRDSYRNRQLQFSFDFYEFFICWCLSVEWACVCYRFVVLWVNEKSLCYTMVFCCYCHCWWICY